MIFKRIFQGLIAVACAISATTHALNPDGFESFTHIGHVYAQTVVTTSDGKPLWAEYNAQGGHSRLHALDGLDGQVLPAMQVQSFFKLLNDFKQQYPEGVEIFTGAAIGGTLLTATGEAIQWPELPVSSATVVFPDQAQRFTTKGDELNKLVLPIDISSVAENQLQGQLTAFFNEHGQFVMSSPERIGRMTAFYLKDGAQAPADAAEYQPASGLINLSPANYQLLNPIAGVPIEAISGYMDGYGVTDAAGYYYLQGRLSPCPGFAYFPEVYAIAKLNYASFNPRSSGRLPYYLTKPSYNSCIGYGAFPPGYTLGGLAAQQEVRAMVMMQPDNITRLNYPVAIQVLNGSLMLHGAQITNDTQYSLDDSINAQYTMVQDDYDGDGTLDTTVQGELDAQGSFQANPNGNRYGVYFSSAPRDDGQPNLIRVMDIKPNVNHQGLLSSLSVEDFQKTDLLVFRASTGQLITQRVGLSADEINTANQRAYFQMAIRGPEDNHNVFSAQSSGWQAGGANNTNQPRAQDSLRPGEQVQIVAINRPSGYIGTATAELTSTAIGGDIGVKLNTPIILSPPNLQIWASRRVQAHGLLSNSDEERYTISNEGAATTDDTLLEIHTQWLDQDGTPLPTGLTGYGYTGRLTKQIEHTHASDDVMDNRVNEFSIDPGRHMQVIRFGQQQPYHHYVQVNGYPRSEQNDFSSGDHSGALAHRPSRYVPLKAPLYNEQGSVQDRLALLNTEHDQRHTPKYHWVYRPELSFSVVDIQVNDILLKEHTDNTSISQSVLDNSYPVITGQEDLVEVLFSLISSEYDRITPLEGEQQYIFALGDNEIEVRIDKSGNTNEQQISFSNLEYLTHLKASDYLTLSLYLNQDSHNLLWNWAYDELLMFPGERSADSETDYIEVNADEVHERPESIVAMLTNTNQEHGIKHIHWTANTGVLSPSVTASAEGIFSIDYQLPTISSDEIYYQATASFIDDERQIKSAKFKVVPGQAGHIFLDHESGQASIAQQGQKQYKFLITDRFGNKVVDGTNVYIDGEDLIINEVIELDQTVLTTKDGEVSFSVQGVNHAGAHTLTLTAGEAQYSTSINIGDIELSITPLSDIFVGSTVEVEITATGDVENLPVMLSAHRGALEEDLVVIKDGRATTTMYVGEFPGSGYLFARIANDVVNQPFNVVNRGNAFLLDTVLVKGSNKGQFTFDNKVYEYTNATQAWIGGVPGESISLDLLNLVDPAIDPLLSYEFTRDYVGNTFLDLQEDTPAHFSTVNIVRTPTQIVTRQAAQLEEHSYIAVNRITKHERTNNIGFVAELKAAEAGTLINYGNQLTLSLLSNGRLVATANTASGTIQVETTKSYKDEWIKLGVHIREGKLQLAVNDDLYEIETEESLNPLTATRLLSIGDSSASTQDFQIASLKLIDWLGVPTLEIVGGQNTHTVGQDGYAKVGLQIPAAYVALSQQREQEKLYQYYAQYLQRGFIPYAYAGDLDDCVMATPVENGFGVSSGLNMLSFIGKCYLNKKAEKATVRVQSSEGGFDLAVALVSERMFKNTAAALAYGEEVLLVANDCEKGALIGRSDSGVMMTCDIITSFLVIGDIRDLGFQGWYWFVDDEENFSHMTATFAGLGLVSAALSPFAVGVPLKATFNTAKIIPKALKGAKFIEPLGHYLQKNILDVKDYEKAAQAAVKVMPLLQVLTFVAFYHFDEEMQPLRELVSEGITSLADLEIWIEFTNLLAEHVEEEGFAFNATTQQQWIAKLIVFLIPDANAASSFASKTGEALGKLAAEIKKHPEIGADPEWAKRVTQAVKRIIGIRELIRLDKLGKVDFSKLIEPKYITDLIKFEKELGSAALDKIGRMGAFETAHNVPTGDIINKIIGVDYKKYPHLRRGIEKTLNRFDSGVKNQSNGAVHEMANIAYKLDRGVEITAIQEPMKLWDKASRIFDYVVKEGDELIYVDVKAWAPNTIRKFLPLKGRIVQKASGDVEIDQLTKDFILAGQGNKMRWEFNQRTFKEADGFTMKELRALFEKEMDKNGEELWNIAKKNRLTEDGMEKFIEKMKGNFEITMGDI